MFRGLSLAAHGLCVSLFIVPSSVIAEWYHPGNGIMPSDNKITEEVTICARGKPEKLECDDKAIRVDAAFYGRDNSETCSDDDDDTVQNTKCVGGSTDQTTAFAAEQCDGKKLCVLTVGLARSQLDDPCPDAPDTSKYLTVVYSCDNQDGSIM